MATIPSGIWPIDATVTSGTELATYLNDWVQAFTSQNASATRPATMQRGGVWAKTLGATDIALMLYDGTADHQIGSIIGGNASFGGGTNAGTTAPASPAVGDMWYDTGASQLKIYDGANWNPVDTKLNPAPITLDTVNNRVGINQATPTEALDVTGTVTADGLTVANTGVIVADLDGGPSATYIRLQDDTDNFIFGTNNSLNSFLIKNETSNATRLTVTNTGRVSFYDTTGTTEKFRWDATAGSLQIGDDPAGANTLGWKNHGNGYTESSKDATTQLAHYAFRNPNGIVGSIQTNASATVYITTSDYRLKEDVQPVANAIDRVKDLKPVNFAWKVDGTRVDGFIAHELQAVIPEAATGTKDAMRDEEYEETPAVLDDDGNVVTPAVMGTRSVPDYQGIDQSKLVPLLTAALQEALGKIDALEANMAKLMKRK